MRAGTSRDRFPVTGSDRHSRMSQGHCEGQTPHDMLQLPEVMAVAPNLPLHVRWDIVSASWHYTEEFGEKYYTHGVVCPPVKLRLQVSTPDRAKGKPSRITGGCGDHIVQEVLEM